MTPGKRKPIAGESFAEAHPAMGSGRPPWSGFRLMAARIFQPDAKLCYAMRLTITAAIWSYGSRIAGDTGQIACVIVDGGRR